MGQYSDREIDNLYGVKAVEKFQFKVFDHFQHNKFHSTVSVYQEYILSRLKTNWDQ